MIQAAGAILAAVLLLGTVLLSQTPRTAPVRAVHGLLGTLGTLLTLAWLGTSTAPASTFLLDGGVLAFAALVLGLIYWRWAGRLGKARMVVLALHGFAGAAGACLIAAIAFAG